MTIKKRTKFCLTCKSSFLEKSGDSNAQWENRSYCSQSCNSSSEKRKTNIFERIKKYQIIKEGCWGWIGSKDNKGYGNLSNRKGSSFSPEKAHRVAYESYYGAINSFLNVCHACDNPECTNPLHLFQGTQKENMQDCATKGRINKVSLLNLRPGQKGVLGAGKYSLKEIKNGKSK